MNKFLRLFAVKALPAASRTQSAAHNRPHRPRGMSMIESLMVLAVVSVTLSAAVPGFQQASLHSHLDGAAAQLEADIQFTRSLAVAEGRSLRMSFHQDSHGSCYVVHGGPAETCTCSAQGTAECSSGEVPQRVVRYGASHPVKLQANVGSIVFSPLLGTSTPTGTLKLQTSPQHAVHAVVNIMGRVRHCAPESATAVKGYPRC